MFPLNEELDAGQEATVLAVDGTTRLGVMLCYEEMIPSTARSLVEQSATLLVTLINGAVFPDPLTLAQQRHILDSNPQMGELSCYLEKLEKERADYERENDLLGLAQA